MKTPNVALHPVSAFLQHLARPRGRNLAIPLALVAGSVYGQPAGTSGERVVLEEVLVTATRRSQSVVDVPYNIQAITGVHLDKIGADEMSDFVRTVPGLSFVDRGPSFGMDLVLRGLRTSRVTSGIQRTTSVYIDDVEIPSNFDPHLVDVSRIEVLRGPQGTLYGSGAIGGAIRYISKTPNFNEMTGSVEAEVGETREGGTNYGGRAVINVPVLENKLAFRGGLAYSDDSGFIDNERLGKEDIDGNQTLTGRFSLMATPTDRLSITLGHLFQNGDFDADTVAYENVGDYANTEYFLGGTTRDESVTNLSVSYDFDAAQLTSSTSNRRRDSRAVRDITALVRDVIYAGFLPPEELPELTSFTTQDVDEDYWSQEFRLVSTGDSKLSWIGGLYWEQLDHKTVAQEEVPIPFPGQSGFEELIGATITDSYDYYYQGEEDFEQYAAFGEIGYELTPRLTASLGARYFEYTSDVEFYAIDQYFGGRNPDGTARTEPFPEEFSVAETEFEDTIFRFNSSYQLNDESLAYVTVAEGYRPGGYNLVGENTGISPSQFQYDPDTIVNYEIGYKADFREQGIFVSAAAFYIDWEDIQTNVITSTGFAVAGNAGKAHSNGLELELQARDVLFQGMDVFASYSYTSTELDETVDGLGFDGERAPYVPRSSGSLGFDYNVALNNGMDAGLNFLATYTGSSATDFGPSRPNFDGAATPNVDYLDLDAYWLLRLSGRLGSGPWTARLEVDNLLDEYADLSRSYQQSLSQYQDPYVYRSVNRPRTVSFSVRYDF